MKKTRAIKQSIFLDVYGTNSYKCYGLKWPFIADISLFLLKHAKLYKWAKQDS